MYRGDSASIASGEHRMASAAKLIENLGYLATNFVEEKTTPAATTMLHLTLPWFPTVLSADAGTTIRQSPQRNPSIREFVCMAIALLIANARRAKTNVVSTLKTIA